MTDNAIKATLIENRIVYVYDCQPGDEVKFFPDGRVLVSRSDKTPLWLFDGVCMQELSP